MSPKGGVGKTTTCVLLASEIVRTGHSVTIIEADPNGHLRDWASRGRLPPQVNVVFDHDPSGTELRAAIEKGRAESSYVIVDTEGTNNQRAFVAASESDLVIIPFQFASMDLSSATEAIGRLDRIEEDADTQILRVLLPTRVSQVIRPASQVQIERALANASIHVLSPGIIEKDAFKLMIAHGCLLQDLHRYANVSNINTAFSNMQAILKAIVIFYGNATREDHDD